MNKLYQKIIPKNLSKEKRKEKVSDLIEELESHDQIKMGIKVGSENSIKKIKKRTRTWMEIMRINPYWKHISAIAMLVTSLADIIIFLYVYLVNYNSLPEIIPATYNQSTKLWNYANKSDMVIVPIIHFIISIILIQLNIVIFKFDRRLVLIINCSMILFNMVFLYEILQIYTMLTVY